MHRNNKTRKSIAVLLVALITVAMLGVSPTLAEAGSCKGAVGALAASGAACLAVANAGVNGTERCPVFGKIRCPIFCTLKDSNPGGYPEAALPSSSFTATLSIPALRLVLSR